MYQVQAAKLKPNQTLVDRTYSNLTSFFWSKNIKLFQWLLKSKFLSFMTNMIKNNGNETKCLIFQKNFLGIYSNLTSFFTDCNTLKYLNGFCQWHLSISLQKWGHSEFFSSASSLFFFVFFLLYFFSKYLVNKSK